MVARSVDTIDCDVLPRFTAAYLRVEGDECAFVEAHTAHALPRLLGALSARGRRPEDVRWIVVTHAHLDHSAGAGALLAACPRATLLAHPRAAPHLIDPSKLAASARRVYGDQRFAELYGELTPAPAERVRALGDGESFALGACKLTVHHTEGHARHHFVVHDPALSAVFTGDAFGLAYPDLQGKGLFALASTSPIDFDPPAARAALERVVGLGAERAFLTHFGEVSNPPAVAEQVRSWVDRSEAWLEECAASDAPAEEQVARVSAALWRAFEERDLPGPWREVLALDVDLNAQGIVVAAQRRKARR